MSVLYHYFATKYIADLILLGTFPQNHPQIGKMLPQPLFCLEFLKKIILIMPVLYPYFAIKYIADTYSA